MDRYIYPAIFDPCEEGGYSITFPDFPGCITEGDTVEEAFDMAKDVLRGYLQGMENDEEKMPIPTLPEKIKNPYGTFISLIDIEIIRKPLILHEKKQGVK